jgi:hypothetical protein
MKKLFTIAMVAGVCALASCGSSETATSIVDSVATVAIDSAAVVADSAVTAAVDSAKVAADSVVKEVTK